MNPDLSLLLIALQQPQVGEQGHAQGTAATNPVDKLRSFVAQQQQQQQFHNHHSTATAPSSSSSSLNHTPAVVAFSACNGITPAVMQTVLDQLSSSSLGATVKRLSLKQNERMHELLVYRKTVMERHDGWRDELFAKQLLDSSFDVEQEEALLEAKISSELYNTHTHIYDQLEGLARQQISDLHALNVPLMHPSHEETEIATQRKLLDIILEMAGG